MHSKLFEYRKQLGLTQSDVAKILKLSTNSYNKKENGIVPFKEKEMMTIKILLKNRNINSSIEDLFY